MIKTVKNLSLAVALVGTCALADTKVEIGGDAEITYKSEETTTNAGAVTDNAYNETEVNIAINLENDDGIKFISEFIAYNGVQATSASTPDSDMKTKQAYIVAPLPKDMKLSAGLMANDSYGGTDVFDDGGENWKTALKAPLGDTGWTGKLVLKKIAEAEAHDGAGDTDDAIFEIDGNLANFEVGVKHSTKVEKSTAGAETKTTALSSYATGSVAGLDLAFEYIKKSSDGKGSGYLVSLAKAINDKLNVGFSYLSVSDTQDGGSEFEPVEVLTGSSVASSASEDASAFVIPVSYAINEKMTANVTYLSADLPGANDASEYALGLEYALGDATSVTSTYADSSIDNTSDTKVMSVAIATEF